MSNARELQHLGYTNEDESAFQELGQPGLSPARVVEEQRGLYHVQHGSGSLPAEAAGRLLHTALGCAELPAVGDWVAIDQPPGATRAIIRALLPRRSALVRKRAGRTSEPQVLASNVDIVFVVAGLDLDFNPRRLERALAMIRGGGAVPVVILNKSDICEDVERRRAEAERVSPGVAVHVLSAQDGSGLEQLAPHLGPGVTIAFIGSSGTGKSTLLNRLAGAEVMVTGPVRAHDSRGRHTTTSRQLHLLPGGALVIDTPGMRELGLWEDAGESLESVFEEFGEIARGCRFRDCRHDREPGCAVNEAVAAGSLEAERLNGYRKLIREAEFLKCKTDKAAAAAETRRRKVLSLEYRRRDGERRQGKR